MRVSTVIAAGASSQTPVLRRRSSDAVTPISERRTTIGPSSSAEMKVASHPRLDPQVSCAVYAKSGRVFARVDAGKSADAADAADLDLGMSLLAADSGVFLAGTQMRLGIDYLVSSNATLCFGEEGNECFVVEFDEESSSGGDAIGKMLMQGMAAGASADVRDALKDKM
jgi:hypothetical protein